MTKPALKPCPFCGGEASLTNVEMAGCAYVACRTCNAQGDDATATRAIRKWNTRAPVTVKPLVWETPNGDENTAATKCGRYVIEYHAHGHQTMFRMVRMVAVRGESPSKRWADTMWADTMAEAKAAAQADHERRILAALTPAAAPQAQEGE